MSSVRQFLAAMLLGAAQLLSAETKEEIVARAAQSAYLLYSQQDDGGMKMVCTVFAIKREDKLTTFLSMAHCVTDESDPSQIKIADQSYFVTSDASADRKVYNRVTRIVTVGRAREGYDFAMIEAVIPEPIKTLELSTENVIAGLPIATVGAPAGIGVVTFFGVVALPVADRPLKSEPQAINWKGCMVVQVPVVGGSSGSPVVSLNTGHIIALVVGWHDSLSIAMPIERVRTKDPKTLLRLDGKDQKAE